MYGGVDEGCELSLCMTRKMSDGWKWMVDGLMTAFAIGVVIWWMSGYGGRVDDQEII